MSAISDTIRCSRKTIEHFRSSGDFDYYSQKAVPVASGSGSGDGNYSNWDPGDLPDISISNSFRLSSSLTWIIVILILLTIAAFVFYILYKKGAFDKKVKIAEEEEEQPVDELAIEGRDLADELETARLAADWPACVRLIYLKSLKHLCDCGILVWNAEKTPAEYSLEAHILPFSQLSNLFMRVRYGLYEVGSDDYSEAEALSEQVDAKTPHEEPESQFTSTTEDNARGVKTSSKDEEGGER